MTLLIKTKLNSRKNSWSGIVDNENGGNFPIFLGHLFCLIFCCAVPGTEFFQSHTIQTTFNHLKGGHFFTHKEYGVSTCQKFDY